jgi:hypothetical protein
MAKKSLKENKRIIFLIEIWFIIVGVAGIYGLWNMLISYLNDKSTFLIAFNNYSIILILIIGFLFLALLSLTSAIGLILHKKWGKWISATFSILAFIGIIISDVIFTQFEFLDIFFSLVFLLSGLYLAFSKKTKGYFR